MPSPDVVRQQIQGSTPVDTLARQVTVLNRLTRIIERMRMAPQRGFNLTPDEKQLSSAYSVASYQLSQSYTKSATPEAVKTFEQMVARYEGDSTLYNQMIGLLSAATLADYRRVDREAGERAQARIDQERREAEQARALPATPAPGRPTMANDPGRVEMRRCLELGGGEAECLGKGLTTGFIDFIGGTPAKLVDAAISTPNPAGVRIGGTFAGPDHRAGGAPPKPHDRRQVRSAFFRRSSADRPTRPHSGLERSRHRPVLAWAARTPALADSRWNSDRRQRFSTAGRPMS